MRDLQVIHVPALLCGVALIFASGDCCWGYKGKFKKGLQEKFMSGSELSEDSMQCNGEPISG